MALPRNPGHVRLRGPSSVEQKPSRKSDDNGVPNGLQLLQSELNLGEHPALSPYGVATVGSEQKDLHRGVDPQPHRGIGVRVGHDGRCGEVCEFPCGHAVDHTTDHLLPGGTPTRLTGLLPQHQVGKVGLVHLRASIPQHELVCLLTVVGLQPREERDAPGGWRNEAVVGLNQLRHESEEVGLTCQHLKVECLPLSRRRSVQVVGSDYPVVLDQSNALVTLQLSQENVGDALLGKKSQPRAGRLALLKEKVGGRASDQRVTVVEHPHDRGYSVGVRGKHPHLHSKVTASCRAVQHLVHHCAQTFPVEALVVQGQWVLVVTGGAVVA
eukprot:RCo026888